jgi:hypothetical protein
MQSTVATPRDIQTLASQQNDKKQTWSNSRHPNVNDAESAMLDVLNTVEMPSVQQSVNQTIMHWCMRAVVTIRSNALEKIDETHVSHVYQLRYHIRTY